MKPKSKELCILDENNYFVDVIKVFIDPKDEDNYAIPQSAFDIPYPNINYLDNGMVAKWDIETKKWLYEEQSGPDTDFVPDPLDILKVARDMRLRNSDFIILEAIENSDNTKLEAIKEYRSELRVLVDKIVNGELPQPELNPNPNPFIAKRDPAELIIFEDWPVYIP